MDFTTIKKEEGNKEKTNECGLSGELYVGFLVGFSGKLVAGVSAGRPKPATSQGAGL